jgi:phenylacetate-CoA ligase
MLALQYQYDYTQWLSPEELRALQFAQLRQLLGHAAHHSPYYRELFQGLGIRPGQDRVEDYWPQIPLLDRGAVQAAGPRIFSGKLPAAHGGISKGQTSGSTGAPVSFLTTGMSRFMYLGISLRDHFWHRRDFSQKMVAIRPEGDLEIGKGVGLSGWGPAPGVLFKTGPGSIMNVRTDIATQAAWLQEQNPVYLHSLPTNLLALARYCRDHAIVLPELREVRTYAEQLSDELRQTCREVWNVAVKDIYSTQELGYLALQCPDHEHYHIQSESALVEIVDESGRPVKEGEIGRVAVTPLHNFAMPLVRYLVGDYAECGGRCACGRGLPVLKRIMGRQRNMLTLPDGRQTWPSFPSSDWSALGPIRQLQLIQTEAERIVANLVVDAPLTAANENILSRYLQERFCHPFTIEIRYVEQIGRSKGGKFEDFISML